MPQGNNHLPLVGSCRFFWGEFEHQSFLMYRGPYTMWGPQTIAKLGYNFNNYGL